MQSIFISMDLPLREKNLDRLICKKAHEAYISSPLAQEYRNKNLALTGNSRWSGFCQSQGCNREGRRGYM